MVLLAAGIRHLHAIEMRSAKQYVRGIEENLRSVMDQVEADKQQLEEHLVSSDTATFSNLKLNLASPYYLFYNGRIIYWSNYHFTPKYRDIAYGERVGCVHTDDQYYIFRRDSIRRQGRDYMAVFVVPLVNEASGNEYIRRTVNPDIFSDSNFDISLVKLDQGEAVSMASDTLFYIKFFSSYSAHEVWLQLVYALLFVTFLVAMAWVVHLLYNNAAPPTNGQKAWWTLVLVLLVMRAVMLISGFPSKYLSWALFDARYYASSFLNPSLGDLILNLLALGVPAWFLFRHYARPTLAKRLLLLRDQHRRMLSVALAFSTFFWLAVHYLIIESLSFHSQWSMDITEGFDFVPLKIVSYLIFFCSGAIYFLYVHVAFTLFFRLNSHQRLGAIVHFALGGLLFAIVAWIAQGAFWHILLVNTAFFVILMLFRLYRYLSRIQYLTFVYLFIFGLPPAVSGAFASYRFFQNNLQYSQERVASQLVVENDPITEYLLNEAAEKIRSDVFIQNRIFSPYASKSIIEQKIKRVYLNNSLEQYDVRVYVFNSRGEPFERGDRPANFNEIKQLFGRYQTESEGLFFINQPGTSEPKRYLYFIDIKRYDQVAGHVLLDLKLRRFVPNMNTVYPLLLLDNRFSAMQAPAIGNEGLSYGIFDGENMVYSYGSYNYKKAEEHFRLSNQRLFDRGIRLSDYQHAGYKTTGDNYIVVSSRLYPLHFFVTNVSFYFLLFVFSMLLVLLVISIYLWAQRTGQNYATRIQLYLNFAFFAPLIIISVTTVSVIVRSYIRDLENQYLQRAENLAGEISDNLSRYDEGEIDGEWLSNEIFQIAQYAEQDLNVFNPAGRLIASSQPLIYENELLSSHINPEAYIQLVEEQYNHAILEEEVGSLRYKNTYIAVKSFDSGSLVGILSLPFFASSDELEKHVVSALSNILNIFVCVFILFLIIAYYASKNLTFPLRLITQKIRRTTLSGYNEPLSWHSEDEIGLMVSEYNRMLVHLEESKTALARSEKESAWREMARQVAHEIKNPLTPMKLTLQHMKRRMQDEKPDVAAQRQIDSLLEQINTLSDIATSFSAFAKMPAPQSERFEITALIRETVALYDKSEKGSLKSNLEEGRFFVIGDRQWIGRALSNIIINGFQASDDEEQAIVHVRFYMISTERVRIEIADNGSGISPEIADKIFTPNFSTKYSGSGLGLAIAKRGIEHAGGEIWFETTEGHGTAFFLEFPTA